MEMSTAQQQAKSAQEQVKEAGRQAAGEAKEVAQQTKHAAQQGVEKLKSEKKPVEAVMSVLESAPKPLYMGLAAGSILASLILYGFRRREDSLFVGQWAPTFLALGIFSRLAKELHEEGP